LRVLKVSCKRAKRNLLRQIIGKSSLMELLGRKQDTVANVISPSTGLRLNSLLLKRDWRLRSRARLGVFRLWMAAAVSVLAARGSRSRSAAVVVEGQRAVLRSQESSRRRVESARAGFSIDDDPRFLFCCLFYPSSEHI
jgi:hypothetical protein